MSETMYRKIKYRHGGNGATSVPDRDEIGGSDVSEDEKREEVW